MKLENLQESMLTEVVKLTGTETLEDLIDRLKHCYIALSIANKIKNVDKDPNAKKYIAMAFRNINAIRPIVTKLQKELDIPE